MGTDTYVTTGPATDPSTAKNRLSSVNPEVVGRKAVSILDSETKRALGPMALRKAGATLYIHTSADYAPTT